MSNILDALRKAQDEKKPVLDHAIKGRETFIAHRPTNRWAVRNKRGIMLCCCGVLLLFGVGWSLYGSPKPATVKSAIEKTASSAQTSNTHTISAQQTLAPSLKASPPPVAAAATVERPQQQVIQTPTTTQTAKSTHKDTVSRHQKNQQRAEHTSPSLVPYPTQPAETVVVSAPDGIKLTGIAWQDSRKLRRAVVNDLLVGEDAILAGAKVIEIKPTTVRFEKNGTIFEVTLSR